MTARTREDERARLLDDVDVESDGARGVDVEREHGATPVTTRRIVIASLGLAACALAAIASGSIAGVDRTSVLARTSLGEYEFKRNGPEGHKFSCEPAVANEFPNALQGDDGMNVWRGSEHKITPGDCSWFKTLKSEARKRAKKSSSCVPDNTLAVAFVDDRNYELAKISTMNVNGTKCFMDRYLLITADKETQKKCEEENRFSCIMYRDGHVFDRLPKHDRYVVLTWMKQKMTLGLLSAGVDFFFHDTDVIFFKVPDFSAILRSNQEATVFYQMDKYKYVDAYNGKPSQENHHGKPSPSPEDVSNLNSGQMFWRATPATLKAQALSLNMGPGGMEQGVLHGALRKMARNGEITAQALDAKKFGTGCANPDPFDFAQPVVVKHLPEFVTLHATCGLGKGGGMLLMNARLKCYLKYHDAKACVQVKSPKDWEKLQKERGAPLGLSEEVREYEATALTMLSLLARHACATAAESREQLEMCANKVVLRAV